MAKAACELYLVMNRISGCVLTRRPAIHAQITPKAYEPQYIKHGLL